MAKEKNFSDPDDKDFDLTTDTDFEDDDLTPVPDGVEDDGFSKFFDVKKLDDFSENTLATVSRGGGSNKCSVSVVYVGSKRLQFSKRLFEKLNSPEALAFKPKGNKLYIAPAFPNSTQYEFSPHPETHNIYTAEIIYLIVSHFNLNYEQPRRVSISFSNINFTQYTNEKNEIIPVAVVDMTKHS